MAGKGDATSPPRRTQDERRRDAETRLLDAAATVIGERGTSRMTLAEVGSAAGYSRGLANHHFGSRAALIDRLVSGVRADFGRAVAPALRDPSPAQRLTGLVRTFVSILADLPNEHRAFLAVWADSVATAPDLREAMADADREFRSTISASIAEGVAAGEMGPDIDGSALAVVLLGQLRGLALQFMIDPDDVHLERAGAEIERMLLLAITPPRP